MTDSEYFASPGLSNSGMSDLAVSPLRYWHLHINPDRPVEEPTPFMQFGSALHCAILEPDEFLSRYACAVNLTDYPEPPLDTIEQLRAWLRDKGHKPEGTRKAQVIEQVLTVDPSVKIMQVIEEEHAARHRGKVIFSVEDWTRLYACARAVLAEPEVEKLLSDPTGRAEVPMTATDPDTGVLIRTKMDWITARSTVEFKTFTQKRGKSIDRSIADAIYYEDYTRQGYVYTRIRSWQPEFAGKAPPDFIVVFVESEPPHEVRIRVLRSTTGGQPNIYWERSRIQVDALTRLYASCMRTYGDKPWRAAQGLDPLIDEEIPQLAFDR